MISKWKKLLPLALLVLIVSAPSVMAQKKKPVRKAKKASATKMSKEEIQLKAAQDLADFFSGKTTKSPLTGKDLKATTGGVVVAPSGQYTNYITGYSVKFPDRNKIAPGSNTFLDDFSVSVAIDGGSSMSILGKKDEFICRSAEDCSNFSIKSLQGLEGFEVLESKDLTIQGQPAFQVKYKYVSDGKTIIGEEVHIFREMNGSNVSYKFSLYSSDTLYETDKTVFENVVSSLKFIKPR